MEDARQIALGGYRRVLENGPDTCDSKSDSEHGDYGEKIPYPSAYTSELLGEDGEPKDGGRPKLSHAQVLSQRAAFERASKQAESTTQAPSSSRPPAPPVPDDDTSVPPKGPKKMKILARKSTQGGAGGQSTVGVQGAMDTRATRHLPSDTLPRRTLSDGPTV
jgi:hypothetical protein